MEKLILRFPKKLTGIFLVVSILTASLSLIGCGQGAVDDTSVIDTYTVTSGSFSTSSSSELSGIGSVRFLDVFNGIYSSNSFSLKADLVDGNSSVSVIFNSTNSVMNSSSGGVAVTFTRSGASVIGSIAVNGSSVTMNPSRLSFYVPAALDVIVEVHNISATQSRVLVWRRDLTVYSSGNADIDTDNSTDLSGTYPSAAGSGQFYGLIVNDATVTAASKNLPKVPN